MGYILPITNFTYHDYQKRDIKKQDNAYYISKPYKVIMDIKHQELIKKQENTKRMERAHEEKRIVTISTARRDDVENTDMRLTGKGLRVNEYV